MSERDMIERMANDGHRLTAEEESLVDMRLASDEQSRIAAMVRALPDEEPAPMWRSQLSERLHVVAAQRSRRAKVAWTLRPALGLGAAAVLSVVFLYRPPQTDGIATGKTYVEAQLISAHRESVNLESFWGSVRADEEAATATTAVANEYQWDETDLGTL